MSRGTLDGVGMMHRECSEVHMTAHGVVRPCTMDAGVHPGPYSGWLSIWARWSRPLKST